MSFKRRVFVSSPADEVLEPVQREIKRRILQRIEEAGYEPQLFFLRGLPENLPWSFNTVTDVMRRCSGAVVIGFPRFVFLNGQDKLLFPTEYTHFEGAIAHALDLPVLTVASEGIPDRGIYWKGGGHLILTVPDGVDASWVQGDSFNHRFSAWLKELTKRRDVFLGYCSQGKLAAQAVHLFLTKELGLSILDWAMDFTGGSTILDEIETAARACTGGIFLFTKDDELKNGDTHQAAPRDNVVFEAGYFIRAKGKERVLIIREAEAKMPADIGGTIYAALPNQQSTSAIEGIVRKFVENKL